MTAGSHRGVGTRELGVVSPAPVLVLGLGNLLLADDAVGLRLLERLESQRDFDDDVDFVDGGTQGLALLGVLADRRAVLVLDAVSLGDEPGTIHVLRGQAVDELGARRASTAHEGNALELFATARMLGTEWGEVAVTGIEPEKVQTGIDLSPSVERSMDRALACAREILEGLVQAHGRAKEEAA